MEIKRSIDAKPRKLQVYKLDKITAAGGISLVVYPENWQDVKQYLTNIVKKTA